MSSALAAREHWDRTEIPALVRAALKLGVLQAVLVALFSVVSRYLDGPIELIPGALIVVVGLIATTVLPGLWTRARTVEGIAGAAAIGLGATVVFMVIDVALLQPLGFYTNRWREIGGGSNWWYLPVWWMVGTYLPWMGAWILANQSEKSGTTSVGALVVTAFAFTVLSALVGIALHVPYAGRTLGTFAVAFLPGITLATVLSLVVTRRA